MYLDTHQILNDNESQFNKLQETRKGNARSFYIGAYYECDI